MKFMMEVRKNERNRPTPRGVGGLKCLYNMTLNVTETSHPTRGGGIEITEQRAVTWLTKVPPHAGWVD